MSTVFICIVAIALLIGLYFVSTQRSLVKYEELAKNALSQIGVQLHSRWDAISTLAKLVAKYSKHEHDSLVDIIAARRSSTASTVAEVQEQQNAFGQVLGRINALAEQYPELKASGLYDNAMNQVTEFENKVRMSRQVYNDSATRMNQLIRQWPSSFVASILGFTTLEYLKTDESKTEMPEV